MLREAAAVVALASCVAISGCSGNRSTCRALSIGTGALLGATAGGLISGVAAEHGDSGGSKNWEIGLSTGGGGGGGGGGSLQIASEMPQPIRPPPTAPPPVESPIAQFVDPALSSPWFAATPEIKPPAVAPSSAPVPIDSALHVDRFPEQPLIATQLASTTTAAASLSMTPPVWLGFGGATRSRLRASCLDVGPATFKSGGKTRGWADKGGQRGTSPPLWSGLDDHRRSDLHALEELDDVGVAHADASVADGLPQNTGLLGPVEADRPSVLMGEADPA